MTVPGGCAPGARGRVTDEPHMLPAMTSTWARACAVRCRRWALAVAVAASRSVPVPRARGSIDMRTVLELWAGSVAIAQHTRWPARRAPALAPTKITPRGRRSQTLTLCNGQGLGLVILGQNVAVPPVGMVRG